MTFITANDAFTNPNSPWYYVVGAAFLVLIIAALVIYNVIAKKRQEKRDAFNGEEQKISHTSPPDEIADGASEPQTTQQPELLEKENDPLEQQVTAQDDKKSEETAQTPTEEEATPIADEPRPTEEKAEENVPIQEETEQKAQAQSLPDQAEAQAETAEQTKEAPTAKAKTTKKPTATAKKTQKPFIDRLIADKSVHAVYNEVKNTILSYPGLKAKLGKEGETFVFGTDSKAEITLDDGTIVLKLAVDYDAVPTQFGASKGDETMPTVLAVHESDIDAAQKLIMFAMNISLLTRNDKHRHVDYVQNAINAKNRAASKTATAKAKK